MEGGAVGHTQGPSMPGFRGEDFLNISPSEKRINLGGHVCWLNGTK